MSSKDSFQPQSQFSIYKIDFDSVEATFEKFDKKKEDKDYVSSICDLIVNSIVSLIKEKPHDALHKIKFGDFGGVVFKTIHYPTWKETLNYVITNNEIAQQEKLPTDFLTNTNVSYVLLYKYLECIYAMTGGYGSNYISKFVEKNYGLYLIPKIISKDDPVVKKVLENNLTGNRASTQRANRNNTSIMIEQDLSSIYKELSIQIDREIANLLGIKFNEDEPKNKKLNVVNKDSIAIRRSFSINELKRIIIKLHEVESKKDKFALNYLVFAKKKGIKNSDLTNALINQFIETKYDKFIFVGDDFEAYYFNASSYEVLKEDGTIFIHKDEPIELKDLFLKFEQDKLKLTQTFISNVIKKWTIKTIDNAGNIALYPLAIINVLQGFIEYGADNRPCYLVNGSWYVFDDVYTSILSNDYKTLYDLKFMDAEDIKKKYGLKVTAINEDIYNNKFKNNSRIIYAHTTLRDNVEIADMIFWDENMVYIMHNKSEFSGIGARDLTNQILTASEYLQKKLSADRGTFLREYYRKLCKKNGVANHPAATEEEFINVFNKKICFIAGFLKGYKKVTQSTYAKYLTFELNKKLISRGQIFIPMGIDN